MPGPAASAAASLPACAVAGRDALPPRSGVLSGVNLDWESQTLADYAASSGSSPSVAGIFAPFPLGAQDRAAVESAAGQVRASGGVLLLTLEPEAGLAKVGQENSDALAGLLEGFNRSGVPVIVRFAHEMNGSWHAWGQQPSAFRAAFRQVAESIHRLAPGSATMWAPNYGGGYPFARGPHQAAPGSPDFATLDTDRDGDLTGEDDPYAPYYPGDDAVDWVGLSIYHWGNTYPWGANVVPEDGKFVDQLTGRYNGKGGDDAAVPDFYAEYGARRQKPVAIAETAALLVSGAGGADELAIKRAWWRQVFDPALHQDYPLIKMVNWFEWDKFEDEVGGAVDWRVAASPRIADAFAADLPSWYRSATPPGACAPED